MHEVLIVGAGPAGLAAALQLKRYGVDVQLLERDRVGGLLNNANLVENYPGFPGGIPGEELIKLFNKQVTEVGVYVTFEEVIRLDYTNGCFAAISNRAIHQSKYAILATGTRGKFPEGLTIPEMLTGRVLTEVVSIKDVEEKRIAILGAGDLAFDFALNLGRRNSVLILNRSDEVKCLPLLVDRARAVSSVKYQDRIKLEAIEPGADEAMILRTSSPDGSQSIQCDYLLSAIGREPSSDLCLGSLQGQVEKLTASGRLYLIGDVKNGISRQAAIAVGDGIMAAMQIYKHMKEKP